MNKGGEINIFCKFVAVTSGKKKAKIDSNTLKNRGERAGTNVYWCKGIQMFQIL